MKAIFAKALLPIFIFNTGCSSYKTIAVADNSLSSGNQVKVKLKTGEEVEFTVEKASQDSLWGQNHAVAKSDIDSIKAKKISTTRSILAGVATFYIVLATVATVAILSLAASG